MFRIWSKYVKIICIFVFLAFFQPIHSQSVDPFSFNMSKEELSFLEDDKIVAFDEDDIDYDSDNNKKDQEGLMKFLGFVSHSGDLTLHLLKSSTYNKENKQDDDWSVFLRLRYGFYGELTDWFEVGVRFIASNNQDICFSDPFKKIQNRSSQFDFDCLYAKTKLGGYGTLLCGCFENPFLSSPILFDKNYVFEGLTEAFTYQKDAVNFYYIFGQFQFPYSKEKMNSDADGSTFMGSSFFGQDSLSIEKRAILADNDYGKKNLYLFASQMGSIFQLIEDMDVEVALSYFQFPNTDLERSFFHRAGFTDKSTVSINKNFRYLNNYRIMAFMTNVEFNVADRPIRFFLTVTNNLGMKDPVKNNRGYEFSASCGHDRRPKSQKTTFSYRWVEKDAMLDIFADDDFGLGGTNYQGFQVRWRFNISGSCDFSVSISRCKRLLLDEERTSENLKVQRFFSTINIRF